MNTSSWLVAGLACAARSVRQPASHGHRADARIEVEKPRLALKQARFEPRAA